MTPRTAHPWRNRLATLFLAASLPLLAACGGGDNPLHDLYTAITINDLDYPKDEERNDEITVEARASSIGEISSGDIDWELDQTSGHDVSNIRKELSDGNKKVVFRFTAPDRTGWVNFRIKVKAKGYSDTETFSIDIR